MLLTLEIFLSCTSHQQDLYFFSYHSVKMRARAALVILTVIFSAELISCFTVSRSNINDLNYGSSQLGFKHNHEKNEKRNKATFDTKLKNRQNTLAVNNDSSNRTNTTLKKRSESEYSMEEFFADNRGGTENVLRNEKRGNNAIKDHKQKRDKAERSKKHSVKKGTANLTTRSNSGKVKVHKTGLDKVSKIKGNYTKYRNGRSKKVEKNRTGASKEHSKQNFSAKVSKNVSLIKKREQKDIRHRRGSKLSGNEEKNKEEMTYNDEYDSYEDDDKEPTSEEYEKYVDEIAKEFGYNSKEDKDGSFNLSSSSGTSYDEYDDEYGEKFMEKELSKVIKKTKGEEEEERDDENENDEDDDDDDDDEKDDKLAAGVASSEGSSRKRGLAQEIVLIDWR